MEELITFKNKSRTQIKNWLNKNNIGLQPKEILKIEQEILKRPLTLTECHCFSAEGSEHCSYRSSKKYLKMLPTTSPDVILGPKEDAGIVAVARDKQGERYGIVIGHESHNHPSQIVPYEGAATGIGGIVRDVACMGAKVIASADPLRFGQIDKVKSRWVATGVISGIAGYGNPIGVPNIAGDIYFNSTFNKNCLVNVVALGLVKESEIIHSYAACGADEEEHDIILVGKATDNSGFGGAAFASFELNKAKEELNKGAVQEPNAFLERHLLVATYDLFNKLKNKKVLNQVGFKDIGGGGILCGSVEITGTAGYGAEIWLDKVHTNISDLPPYVILCAETQERFIWTTPKSISQIILKHYNQDWDLPKVSVGAKAEVIGKVTTGNYKVFYKQKIVVDAKSEVIREGLSYERKIVKPKKKYQEPKLPEPKDYLQVLKKILTHENIASRQPVYEQYDKNVQGQTIIESGQADAGLIAPFIDPEFPSEIRNIGVALTVDGNPRYGQISPYWQAVNAICEALRNIAAIGAKPIALTDCLNYGNPEKPEQMWQFVEAVKGITQAAKNIHLLEHPDSATPIISGNVSFYNEAETGAIAPQAIISCLGKIADYHQAITTQIKETNQDICLIGKRKNELGGSVYYQLFNHLGTKIPQPKFVDVEKEIKLIHQLIKQSLISACHDISDGGLAVTLAEMTFRESENKIGIQIDINNIPQKNLSIAQKLFSETGGFIFTSQKKYRKEIKKQAEKLRLNIFLIGQTTKQERLIIANKNQKIINSEIKDLEKIWLNSLRDKL